MWLDFVLNVYKLVFISVSQKNTCRLNDTFVLCWFLDLFSAFEKGEMQFLEFFFLNFFLDVLLQAKIWAQVFYF